MRIGVRVGPVWISSGSSRRRRRRSTARTWRGTGQATTPDRRLVKFQCGHQHRTQTAALECVQKRKKQIERGQNLHLVTRVLETPESREAAQLRAAQKKQRQRELAAQRAEAARVRAQQREVRERERAARRAEAARLRTEQKATRRRGWAAQKEARQANAAARRSEREKHAVELAAQRGERREQRQARTAAQRTGRMARRTELASERAENAVLPQELAGHRAGSSRHRAERRPKMQQTRTERRMRRPSRGWPTWGSLTAGAAVVVGVALTIAAGNHPKSGLAVAGAALVFLAVVTGVVCAVGAVWRRVKHHRMRRPVSVVGTWPGGDDAEIGQLSD